MLNLGVLLKRSRDAIRSIVDGKGPDPSESWPDFSDFEYSIVRIPQAGRLRAWDKVRECERRLAVFEWAESLVDPASASNRVFLDDSLSAYLLTFEAALQFVKEQFRNIGEAPNFDSWLRRHQHYDIDTKGVRTLRHFAAHVQLMPAPSQISVSVGGTISFGRKRHTSTSTVISRKWLLPQISPGDLSKLKSSPLSPAELAQWNSTAANSDALLVLRSALKQLNAIAETAETIV